MFCDLRGSKTTFLPGMGGRGGELRDAGWAESLSVDNLIRYTGIRKNRSCMMGKEGALSGGKWESNHSQEADGTWTWGSGGDRRSRSRR